jgi:pimeloyl-ACP methyl ester carboxylesterase
MKRRASILGAFVVLLVMSVGAWRVLAQSGGKTQAALKMDASRAMPPKSIPTFSTENLARTGFFYAGGEYIESKAKDTAGQKIMHGSMYVEVWVPKNIRHPYPMVFYHGAGQTGIDWLQTPDGRPGWAYYLIGQGYVLYMVDYPTRGRSVYVPEVDGPFNIRTANNLETIWTDSKSCGGRQCPPGTAHTQWPGPGTMGDPVFDTFVKTQVQFAGPSTSLAAKASLDLLDKIGTPVILFTHSQGGGVGWEVADQRPNLVKGIVTVEPGGGVERQMLTYDPPITRTGELKTYKEAKGEREGENPCTLQMAPVHKLVNFQNLPVLDITGDGGYHRPGDACPPKWINQAGGHVDFVRLEDVGIKGNGHMMMLEKNSDAIIKFIDDWVNKNIK